MHKSGNFFWTKRKKLRIKQTIGFFVLLSIIAVWILSSIKENQTILNDIKIVFEDSVFMYNKSQIIEWVKQDVGAIEKLVQIDLQKIEKNLKSYSWIKDAQAFILNSILIIKIKFKSPILKIISNDSNIYYMDELGDLIPVSDELIADVPLLVNFNTNANDSNYFHMKQKVIRLAKFLFSDTLYSSKKIYIDIAKQNQTEMIVYNPLMKFILGDLDNIEMKIKKSFFFYEFAKAKQFRFEKINVQYHNQIIGITHSLNPENIKN